MIFATVGTQLPFPRFLETLDKVAGRHGLEIVAQTCDPTASYTHLKTYENLSPADFDAHVRSATVIVGHAGIGTILSAARASKPAILFARRADLGEHRNDHQLATIASFGHREGIYPASSEQDLERHLTARDLKPFDRGDDRARAPLIAALSEFIVRG